MLIFLEMDMLAVVVDGFVFPIALHLAVQLVSGRNLPKDVQRLARCRVGRFMGRLIDVNPHHPMPMRMVMCL